MSKFYFKPICNSLMIIAILMSLVFSAGAAEKNAGSDTIELKNGTKVTGTVLNDSFTVTTAYMTVTLERERISEITMSDDHDVAVLDDGASLVEGTIDEYDIFFKSASGEKITYKKEECKKIVFKKGSK